MKVTATSESPSLSELVSTVSRIISKARSLHPQIPAVLPIVGSPGKSGRRQAHGHFARDAWQVTGSGERIHELSLAGESLARGGRDTLGTILHELAHALCAAEGIQDTSNAGRYHNKRFKEVAESFGLEIGFDEVIGHSVTTVPDTLANAWSEDIAALDAAIIAFRDFDPRYRVAVPGGGAGGTGDSENAGSVPPNRGTGTNRKLYIFCPECKNPLSVGKDWAISFADKITCSVHNCPYELTDHK